MTAQVYLVDDDPSVLKALCRLLRSAGLRPVPFTSPQEFMRACDPTSSGCVVLDVTMPHLDGLELQRMLAARDFTLPIIFLTGHGDIPMSVQAMKRGAVDFLAKPVEDEALLAAVREALRKDEEQASRRAELAAIRRRMATLTPRESEVLGHVVSGLLNKEVAALLGTAEKTVKVQRARVMEKMEATSLAELVRMVERSR